MDDSILPIVVYWPPGLIQPQNLELLRNVLRRERTDMVNGWNGADILPVNSVAVTRIRPPYAQSVLFTEWLYLKWPEGTLSQESM